MTSFSIFRFLAVALVATGLFISAGTAVHATGPQRQSVTQAAPSAAVSGPAMPQVVVLGHKMSDAEKAAFDRAR